MSVKLGHVNYISRLARLSLTDSEKAIFTEQLNGILKFMDKLKELDTDAIEANFNLHVSNNTFRNDKVNSFADIKAISAKGSGLDPNCKKKLVIERKKND